MDDIFSSPLSCCILAKRNSGKTFMLKEIIKKKLNDYDIIGIFTATGYLDDTWKELAKKKNVILDAEFDKNKILQLLDYINQSVCSGNPKLKILLILDDLTDEFKLDKRDALNQLAFKSRHYGIDYIFTCHRYMTLSPLIRQNSTTQIFFKPNNSKELKAICEDLETFDNSEEMIAKMLNDLDRYETVVCKKNGSKDEFYKFKV